MKIDDIVRIKSGDIIEWLGKDPDVYKVIKVFPGNPSTIFGYEYRDWSFRVESRKDGHSELISGDEMDNIHFIKK